MSEEKAQAIAEQVVKEMDKMVLLGAAFDCMSEAGQQKFKEKISKIVLENS